MKDSTFSCDHLNESKIAMQQIVLTIFKYKLTLNFKYYCLVIAFGNVLELVNAKTKTKKQVHDVVQ